MLRALCVTLLLLLNSQSMADEQGTEQKAIVYIRVTENSSLRSEGSGTLVSPNGLILTSGKVVRPALSSDGLSAAPSMSIAVSLVSPNQHGVSAEFVRCATDGADICLLRINVSDLVAARIEQRDIPDLGCWAMHIDDIIRARGYFYLDRPPQSYDGHIAGQLGSREFYPAQFPVNSSMAGGPVYDESGQVIIGISSIDESSPTTGVVVPLTSIHSELTNKVVPCENDYRKRPHLGEGLMLYVTGSEELKFEKRDLMNEFNKRLRFWSNEPLLALWKYHDEFLEDLGDAILVRKDVTSTSLRKMFNDHLEWLAEYDTRWLYILLVRMEGSNSTAIDVSYSRGLVRFSGGSAQIFSDDWAPDGPYRFTDWNTDLAAADVMTELGSWKEEKFIKKEIRMGCILAQEQKVHGNLGSFDEEMANALWSLADSVRSVWSNHPIMGGYKVEPVDTTICKENYEAVKAMNQYDVAKAMNDARERAKGNFFPRTLFGR